MDTSESAAKIVRTARNGTERRIKYDPNDINHCWAKAFFVSSGPSSTAYNNGISYQYVPAEVDG